MRKGSGGILCSIHPRNEGLARKECEQIVEECLNSVSHASSSDQIVPSSSASLLESFLNELIELQDIQRRKSEKHVRKARRIVAPSVRGYLFARIETRPPGRDDMNDEKLETMGMIKTSNDDTQGITSDTSSTNGFPFGLSAPFAVWTWIRKRKLHPRNVYHIYPVTHICRSKVSEILHTSYSVISEALAMIHWLEKTLPPHASSDLPPLYVTVDIKVRSHTRLSAECSNLKCALLNHCWEISNRFIYEDRHSSKKGEESVINMKRNAPQSVLFFIFVLHQEAYLGYCLDYNLLGQYNLHFDVEGKLG